MRDLSDDSQAADLPRKRAAIGDGISAGSGSPYRDSPSPGPYRSKARPTSGQFESTSDTDNFPREMQDAQGRPPAGKHSLWEDGQKPLSKSAFIKDPSNIASVAAQRARAQQQQQSKPRKGPQHTLQPSLQSPKPIPQHTPVPLAPQAGQQQPAIDNYDLVLQPETRPISQEQLVAEVKGIYVSLVFL